MSFQPVLPFSGYSGWTFLNRTMAAQRAAFHKTAQVTRETDYFRANIGKIRSAEDLVSDRRLLTVALGAFGLDADIAAKAFIRKVLSEGTTADTALASRLADKRYAQLSNAFGFATVPNTGLTGFADAIINRYEARSFEAAVGEQNASLRLALNVSNGVADVLAGSQGGDARWFAVMGSAPLRKVFETALGFPSSFGSVDLDRQLSQFQQRARATFGTSDVGDFAKPAVQEKLIRLFLVRSETQSSGSLSGASAALTLLSSAAR